MFKVNIEGLRKNFLNIFDDPAIFVRELIQNSWEAILLRREEDDSFEPCIDLSLNGNTLSITDNGVGMTEETIKQVLPTLFHSDWSRDDDRNGIGQFGMGIKTVFLVSNVLKIRTYSKEQCEGYEWSIDLNTNNEPTFRVLDDYDSPGTTVTIELDRIEFGDNIIDGRSIIGTKEKLEQKVRFYADFLPCPIVLDGIQINLGGMSGLDEVDYEPIEWYEDNFDEFSSPMAIMPFETEFARGVFFPVEKIEKAEIVLFRMGLRVGKMRSDEIFSYFGHHVVGFVECQNLDVYVDRHRVKEGKSLDKFKDEMDNVLETSYIQLAKKDNVKFNNIIRAHPIDMKISLFQRDAFRKEVWSILRWPLENGRWSNMDKLIENALKKEEKPHIFYASGTQGQSIMIHLLTRLDIPVLSAYTKAGEHYIDVLLLKEIANDCRCELRRVDQALDVVLENIDIESSFDYNQYFLPLIKDNEEIRFYKDQRIDFPILCRVADTKVEDEIVPEQIREKRKEFLEIISLLIDEDEIGILDKIQENSRNVLFVNLAHPVISSLFERKQVDKRLEAVLRLLILDAYVQAGVMLSDEQALLHNKALLEIVTNEIDKKE